MPKAPQARFGVLLPTREAVMTGRTDPESFFTLAERAEALEFHSLWVGDSLTARRRMRAISAAIAGFPVRQNVRRRDRGCELRRPRPGTTGGRSSAASESGPCR